MILPSCSPGSFGFATDFLVQGIVLFVVISIATRIFPTIIR